MALAVAVLMDPIGAIKIAKDTTFALLLEAQKRGHRLYYLEQSGLGSEGNHAFARMAPLSVVEDSVSWFTLGEFERRPLASMDVLLLRKDPPFDREYLYDTHIAELAEREGVLVVNRPQALRDANEKLFALHFPDCCPPTLVARDPTELRAFVESEGLAVLKPLDGMGGRGVFRVRADDPNRNVIIETLSDNGSRSVMAQTYLPAISEGDKRILLIGGEVVPWCLARVPKAGESRGNLAAGGTGIVQALAPRDREIGEALAPIMAERGLLFVGIDVIGDYLTEINVTSPTCMVEIHRETGFDAAALFIAAVEKACTAIA